MYSDSVYVVFSKAKSNGWMFKFLHPFISHCFVMWEDKGQWIVYDKSVVKTSIFTVTNHSDIIAQSIVIKVNSNPTVSYFNLGTCVSSVKEMIGIRNPFILTPYQLFKRLSQCQVKAPHKS